MDDDGEEKKDEWQVDDQDDRKVGKHLRIVYFYYIFISIP